MAIMAIYLFEPNSLRQRFYPLSKNKNVTDLLIGRFDFKTWWEILNIDSVHILTEDFLQAPIPDFIEPGEWLILGSTLPVSLNLMVGSHHKTGMGYKLGTSQGEEADELLAVRLQERISTQTVRDCIFKSDLVNEGSAFMALLESQNITWEIPDSYQIIDTPEKLLASQKTGIERSAAFILNEMNTGKVPSEQLHENNRVTGSHPVILEDGAEVSMSLLNTEDGPIYIGRGARVMEGCMIRGPFYLGAFSAIKMGTRIYGPVVTGPYCTLGGEIKNCLFHEGSNKGHDGYLGDSIIGSWCNFGAGSGGSNVKNTGGEVSLYDYNLDRNRFVGKKFGALVGDYTRIGVGIQLNAGSSIGVSCSLAGPQMPPAIVPDFSWRTEHTLDDYQIDKAIEHIRRWKAFKRQILTDREIQILRHIFDQPGLRG